MTNPSDEVRHHQALVAFTDQVSRFRDIEAAEQAIGSPHPNRHLYEEFGLPPFKHTHYINHRGTNL